MKESDWHKEKKDLVRGIAREKGFATTTELPSPLRMAFASDRGKSRIDVWCEYFEKDGEVLLGRQIPVEVDYSEYIGFRGRWDKDKGKYVSSDLEKYEATGRMPEEWIPFEGEGDLRPLMNLDPHQSIRLVISRHVYEAWINSRSEPYPMQIVMLPGHRTDLIRRIFSIGKQYLIPNFEPKIGQLSLDHFTSKV